MADTARLGKMPVPINRMRPATRTRWARHYRKVVIPWLFVLPIMLINVVVVIGPSAGAVYYSLTDWSGVGPAEFIGLENFRTILFDDTDFRRAFLNNLSWLAFFLTVPFIVSLFAAGMLARVRR